RFPISHRASTWSRFTTIRVHQVIPFTLLLRPRRMLLFHRCGPLYFAPIRRSSVSGCCRKISFRMEEASWFSVELFISLTEKFLARLRSIAFRRSSNTRILPLRDDQIVGDHVPGQKLCAIDTLLRLQRSCCDRV